jgi:hypothetical protein
MYPQKAASRDRADRVSKTAQRVEKVVVGPDGSPKHNQNTPKLRPKHYETGVSSL